MKLIDFNPERLRALHIGGYGRRENDIVRQMMLGLKQTGATVFEYNTDEHRDALDTDGRTYDRGTTSPVWLRWETLQPVVEYTRPHLIVCNAGGLSFRPPVAARLRRDCTLLGIALSDPEVFEPTTRHIAANFDLFLTCVPSLVESYEDIGARCSTLPVATNERFFYPVEPHPALRCEVLMMGRALPRRIEPVKRLIERFDVHLYGEGWEPHGLRSRGFIYAEKALAALSSAKMSVLFLKTVSGYPMPKVGLFDFTAAGALVLAEYSPEVDAYFRYGEEIVGFKDTDDLIAQVSHFLAHPTEAERIRQRGRARTLKDHTWTLVWRRILKFLKDFN